jgi:1-acyl-sn-glycerol-3-phosphate acyltransferase
MKALACMYLDVRVSGICNVPRRGGVILASNHQSFMDPVIIGTSLRRPLAYLARQSLYRNRFFGRMILALNAMPVPTAHFSPEALRRAVRLLRGGWPLVIFPEGTRTEDGKLLPLRRGISLLAARAGAPVTPVRISGAFESWPRHRLFPRPGKITIAFGPLLVYDSRTDTYDSFTKRLYQSLIGLGGGRR